MVPKLQRDYLAADLAAVEGILTHLTDEQDAVNRLGFEYRRDEIHKEIESMGAVPEENEASFALFFGGEPVIGNQGIESEFSAEALSKFQDIVEVVNTTRLHGTIKNWGRVAAKDLSKLHITRTLKGSFGFQLEEIQSPDKSLFPTRLKEAVQQVSELMESFGDPDDKAYIEALANSNKRTLDRVREYFELLHKKNATWRIVSGDIDREFNRATMSRAMERIEHASVDQVEERALGILKGVLPVSHEFEYEDRGRVIKGNISKTIPVYKVEEMQKWVGVESRALLQVKHVRRGDALLREAFTLMRLSGRPGPKPKTRAVKESTNIKTK